MSCWERHQWKRVSRSTWHTHKVFANLTTQIKWQAPKHHISAFTKNNLTVEGVQISEKTRIRHLGSSGLSRVKSSFGTQVSFRLSNSVTRPLILDPDLQTSSSFRIAGSVPAHLFTTHVWLFHWLRCAMFFFLPLQPPSPALRHFKPYRMGKGMS